MRKKILLFTVLLCFLFLPRQTYAANFSTTYKVTYSVKEDGTTHAVFATSLKNQTSDYYASSYELQVGFDNLQNVRASDPDGPITPEIIKIPEGYKIKVHFNKKVVGFGNTLPFSLSFDTNEVAKKTGQIWEINIPGIGNQENFSDFNVHVNVPQSFGKPVYIKPQQQGNSLDFTKEQLGKSGISITFGNNQIYHFNLKYHLANTHVFPIKTEIALPPSTNYQEVYINSMNPKPDNVTRDPDGNWLASYVLLPSKNITVTVDGNAYVSLHPKQETLSGDQTQQYLQQKQYWETTNTRIRDVAKTLHTPGEIYEYVRTHLTYDFSRVSSGQERLGAANVLRNPGSAVCLEFTDLFIALSRAAGIPARELDGFAYTQNARQRPLSLVKDVLHAWPEYYDKNSQQWVMVDPTWGNTTGGVDYFHTLDFDHVVFVIKGQNSTYPVPAGGYKLEGQENMKDVDVTFGQDTEEKNPKFSLHTTLPEKYLSYLPIKGTVTIENTGSALLPQQKLTIDALGITPDHQGVYESAIPPFGKIIQPFSFHRTPFLTNTKAVVTIQASQAIVKNTIDIQPIFWSREVLLIGGGALACITIIILITSHRARRVSVS